ncbi:MAG TPA: hypothetical protein VEN78_19195, partial [Bradyrhizobium sp.]|nr:hypothetical protein [Bradyrhizobium sp.]
MSLPTCIRRAIYHLKDDGMQMRSRTYDHFISLWRSFRGWIPPHGEREPAETSPSFIYIAVVLTFLLIILEM